MNRLRVPVVRKNLDWMSMFIHEYAMLVFLKFKESIYPDSTHSPGSQFLLN